MSFAKLTAASLVLLPGSPVCVSPHVSGLKVFNSGGDDGLQVGFLLVNLTWQTSAGEPRLQDRCDGCSLLLSSSADAVSHSGPFIELHTKLS